MNPSDAEHALNMQTAYEQGYAEGRYGARWVKLPCECIECWRRYEKGLEQGYDTAHPIRPMTESEWVRD